MPTLFLLREASISGPLVCFWHPVLDAKTNALVTAVNFSSIWPHRTHILPAEEPLLEKTNGHINNSMSDLHCRVRCGTPASPCSRDPRRLPERKPARSSGDLRALWLEKGPFLLQRDEQADAQAWSPSSPAQRKLGVDSVPPLQHSVRGSQLASVCGF